MGGRRALTFVVVVPILMFGLIWVARHAMPAFRSVFRKYDKLNESIEENVRAMRVVKGFAREEYEKKKFGAAADSGGNKPFESLSVRSRRSERHHPDANLRLRRIPAETERFAGRGHDLDPVSGSSRTFGDRAAENPRVAAADAVVAFGLEDDLVHRHVSARV
jgi:ABC-type multidrug transport system fused ATPase/permease subunit